MKMKTIKMKKTIIFMLSLAMLSVSCSDFLDVNENPNSPAISTPSLTLPVPLQSFAALNARTLTYLGNQLVVNWATPSNWSANAIYMRYDFSASDFTGAFQTPYISIFKDLTYVATYEDPTGAVDYTNYKAIAAIVKGFQYQLLVDLYGDVPYTEANLRGENTTPVYDDAETIYKAVIDELTNVVGMINNAPANAEDPGDQDIIFKGHMDEWAAFANSIKLRMLVRLSNTGQDAYITGQIASINANGAGYITESTTANPTFGGEGGYTSDSGKQSPFWDYYRQAVTGAESNRGDYTIASAHTINHLTSTNDPRLDRIYASSADNHDFKGAVQSTTLPGTGFTSDELAKIGPGLLVSAGQDQIIMSLTEALFVQAEATARGYLPGGDAAAKTLYESAIEASFVQLGVVDAATEAATYYSQTLNNVGWDDSTDKIEAIITQKWVALNGTSSIESWIDLTRTGFPLGLPIPAESAGVRPVSLLYPSSEGSRNSNNVPSQTAGDVFTNFPFWK